MVKKVLVYSIVLLAGLAKIGRAEEKQIAVLSASSGEVLLQEAEKTLWQSAEEGTFLFEGDKIQTREDSSAEITFDYESIVELSENSLLEIKNLKIKEDNSEESVLKLEIGRVLAEVEKLPVGSRFEIHTPTAVVGVRGTQFLLEEKDGESSIAVFEGKVGVRGITKENLMTKEILVLTDYETLISRYKTPQIPRGLSPKMRILKKRFPYLKERIAGQKKWWQGLGFSERKKIREKINKYKKLPFKQQQEIKKRIKELGWRAPVQQKGWEKWGQPKRRWQPKRPFIPYQPGRINGYPR